MLRRPVFILAALVLAVAAALVPAGSAAPRKAAPSRIISLSPTATETLFAIGAGKQVIAVDADSSYPRAAPRTALSGLTPNIESIAAYRPDLVVIAYDPGGLRSALERLHIPVLMQDAAPNLQASYAQMLVLGRDTGHLAQAQSLVARMKKRIAALVSGTHGRGRGLTVYHELDPTLYSATSKTFVGQIYSLFGLHDIADAADKTGSGYPQLSSEYVVAANPDLVVLADTVCCGQSLATLRSRPGWNAIDAVRNGDVVRIDDSIASRWGPRTVDFVRAIASALAHLRK
ncbi:MAG TPA: ABC transporter substrate-binding protein [Gaiellaceae bacterium]|nr:ABC transporter substrate-binding protein [Gaiellaceae bacterium]